MGRVAVRELFGKPGRAPRGCLAIGFQAGRLSGSLQGPGEAAGLQFGQAIGVPSCAKEVFVRSKDSGIVSIFRKSLT